MDPIRIFASTGKPIMQSASPLIHNAGFAACGVRATYTRLAADSMEEALETARQIGMSGLNVTAPFKESACRLADRLDADALATGAVNTLLISKGGKTRGFNTDVEGVRSALAAAGVRLQGANAVVLGAGGAARAAAYSLCKSGARVTVANRTAKKAKEIAALFGCGHCSLSEKSLASVLPRASVIVSTLSTKDRVVPRRLLEKGTVLLDAFYSSETSLSRDAAKAGCKVIGGKEWLLHQGAAAFTLFTGKAAPLEAMRRALQSSAGKPKKENMALIGFMGSGKSTVARLIGRKSGMPVLETDEMAERKAGMSVPEIFEKHGEARFRALEAQSVEKACAKKGSVVSLGGGALQNPKSARIVKDSCVVAWLWASAGESISRLQWDASRPLLKKAGKAQAARKLLRARLPIYAIYSDIVFGTGGKSAKKVAGQAIGETGIALRPAQVGEGRMKRISPGKIDGTLDAPPSKSMMIRAVAAALLSDGKTSIIRPSFCGDALAALECARALGAKVKIGDGHVEIKGIGRALASGRASAQSRRLDCGESGLCMRMFPPIAALGGGKTLLTAKGTLAYRNAGIMEKPLSQLGAACESKGGLPPVFVQGPMNGGRAEIDGSESSQFLTGLLVALPLCKNDSVLTVKNLKSGPYVEMTLGLLRAFGVKVRANAALSRFEIPGRQHYSPLRYEVEGDWSGAAFMLVAGAIAGGVSVKGLRADSVQADRAVLGALKAAGAKVKVSKRVVQVCKGPLAAFSFDATGCPDLFPPLAALACHCDGTSRIRGATRLAGKESDRAAALVSELGKMGAAISVKGDVMEICGKRLSGGAVDSHGDHRIAMACAVAALASEKGARISGAACVSKSYPRFFDDLGHLKVKT